MNICHIDETRSRITVSNINDVPLKWSATGCVNDRTQFGHSGARWSRSFVPNSEATIDIRNFEPQNGTYSVDRYFPGTDTVEAARKNRERYKVDECITAYGELGGLEEMEVDIGAILHARSHETMIYQCAKQTH